MTRVFTILLTTVFAMPAFADKVSECADQAGIVQSVVDTRLDGVRKAKALRQAKSDLTETTQTYETVLPAIVDWIYSLPEDQLTDQVGPTYAAACEAQ